MGTTITASRPAQIEVAGIQTDDDFTSSYRSSLGRLVGFFRAKGVPRDEAADLANETMVRMLVHLKRHGRDRTDLGPLVRTIARNLLIERVRKQAPVIVPLGDDIDVADDGLEPADQFLASERRDAVRKAIHSLSPRHRHVVGLWMEGRTPADIARELGIKRNAVDAILHRARRSLAAKLDGGGILGVFGLVGLRLRLLARRVSDAVVSLDPSGQTAPTGLVVATMGMAAVLTFSSPATAASTAPSVAAPASAGQALKDVTKTANASDRPTATVGSAIADPSERIRTTSREFGTSIKTADGEEFGIGITERERNDGQPSLLGPILSKLVTDNMCRTQMCAER